MLIQIKRVAQILAVISVLYVSAYAFGENPTEKKIKELDAKVNSQQEQIVSLKKEAMVLNRKLSAQNDKLEYTSGKVEIQNDSITNLYDETKRLDSKGYEIIEVQK